MSSYPANAGGVEDVELPWAVAVVAERMSPYHSNGGGAVVTGLTRLSDTKHRYLRDSATALALHARGAAPRPRSARSRSSATSSRWRAS